MPVGKRSCFKEISDKHPPLTDVGETPEFIQILIGAGIIRKSVTGRREMFSAWLAALVTHLRWIFMGYVSQDIVCKENLAFPITLMFLKKAVITDL